jgi:hypothetical protein
MKDQQEDPEGDHPTKNCRNDDNEKPRASIPSFFGFGQAAPAGRIDLGPIKSPGGKRRRSIGPRTD